MDDYTADPNTQTNTRPTTKGQPRYGGRSYSSMGNPRSQVRNSPKDLKKSISRTNSKEKIQYPQDSFLRTSDRQNMSIYNPRSHKLVDTYSYFKYKGPNINYTFGRGKRFKRISGMKFMRNVPYYISAAHTTLNSTSKGITFGVGNRKSFHHSRQSSPPPGAYELKSSFNSSRQKNNCNWGKRTEKINKYQASIPGPGAYDVPSTVCSKYSKKFSIQGKIVAATLMQRCGTPGPIYQNYSNLCDSGKFKNITFGKGKRTFLNKQMLKTESPGPGAYMMDTSLDLTSPTGFSMTRPTTAAPGSRGILLGNIGRARTPGINPQFSTVEKTRDTTLETSDNKLWES